jgi:EAL domain-containing protein (putative c-di-GMP-specific phosphodiesterase class I)
MDHIASESEELRRFLRERAGIRIGSAAELLPDLLRATRLHLNMDVAFVSRFDGGLRVFAHVDAAPTMQAIRPGDADPLEETYCQRVIDGRLPELIHNAQEHLVAREIAATNALPVGAHLSVPIRLQDGTLYGTFCCFSSRGNRNLTEADLRLMRVLADMAATFVERELEFAKEHAEKRRRIESVLAEDALSMVYQPIKEIDSGEVVGFEALTRFRASPARAPDVWFNEAAEVGLGEALEIRAIEKGLQALHRLPSHLYVSCNVSAEVVLKGGLGGALDRVPLPRVLLEITEHASVHDYDPLVTALAGLRERGLRLAVDDAGAGYASFRHILSLQPDVIKLDTSLTRNIDSHLGRRALASAFIGFAHETGSRLVAEGVETEQELKTLRALGVHKVQGYFVGRPAALDDVLAELATERGRPSQQE